MHDLDITTLLHLTRVPELPVDEPGEPDAAELLLIEHEFSQEHARRQAGLGCSLKRRIRQLRRMTSELDAIIEGSTGILEVLLRLTLQELYTELYTLEVLHRFPVAETGEQPAMAAA